MGKSDGGGSRDARPGCTVARPFTPACPGLHTAQVATLHVVHLCVGCVCLAVLVLMAAWMAGALRAAQREQRLW